MIRRPIHTVLVANRGEIAMRVIRACRETGRRSVAIYTELDREAPHVRAADEAVEVRSYLDIEAVLAAAQSVAADAVHPGYGFLSERAAFAEALEAVEIRLVGPTAAVMDAMGRKDAAREIAVKAGVPVVPTGVSTGSTTDMDFPVLVKAAAGGGGKGMRIVRRVEEYDEAVAAARREALSAFGDDTILVEKFVEHGRHIEVQVLADQHGNVVHLHERDCSTQRRHQKVLEEAPAPTISDAVRRLVTESAVALAREVGYTNAGTVEFLLDTATDEAYFLEMNTRLQVEHPVTEAVTGLDLVQLQLDVAAGEPLPFDQEDIRVDGHAIEARVYAEDSFGGFLPQAGRADLVRWPDDGSRDARFARSSTTESELAGARALPNIRVDQALESGQVVSTAYDPMLGKVIAHGPDREAARLALLRALDRTEILGLTTNTGFLRALVAGDEFRTAAIDTAWLDHHEVPAPDPAPARQLAAWEVFRRDREEYGPFASDGFRLSSAPAPVVIELDEPVVLGPRPAVRPAATIRQGRVEVTYQGQRFVFERADVFADHGPAAGDGTIASPMPGTVLDVRVAVGDAVAEGDVLGVVEAMKMELALKAPFAGAVAAVDATVGEQVSLGHQLFRIEKES